MKADNLLKQYVFWPEINNEFHQNIDFSKTSTKEVADNLYFSASIEKKANHNLRDYILRFYGYNEYLNNLRQNRHDFIEKDDLTIFHNYQQFSDEFSKKMLSYLLYCCLSEARQSDFIEQNDSDYREKLLEAYISSIKNDKKSPEYQSYLSHNNGKPNPDYSFSYFLKETVSFKDITAEFTDFYLDQKLNTILSSFKENNLHNKPSFKKFLEFVYQLESFCSTENLDGDGGFLQRFLATSKQLQISPIANLPIETLFEYLSILFTKGFKKKPSFGGSMWASISDHALDYVRGTINTEMFLDKAFSLEHNGGHIFNKDYIFNDFSERLSLEWFTSDYNPHYLSLHQNQMFFNLQNSSSILFFFSDNLEKLNFLSNKKNLIPMVKMLVARLNEQDISISDSDSLRIANSIHHSATHFLKAFNLLTKTNTDFLSQIKHQDLNSSLVSFDFSQFLISCYRATRSENSLRKIQEFEKNIQQSKPVINLFSDFLNGTIKLDYIQQELPELNNISIVPKCNLYEINSMSSAIFTKEAIGSKAYGLSELIELGFNVPKAMVFDTHTCLSYLQDKKSFQQFFNKNKPYYQQFLVDEEHLPILVSVRSGSSVSMPGMMDSILNVGIDNESYPLLVKKYSKAVIDECAIHFMKQFCSSAFGLSIVFPKSLDAALDKFTTIIIKNDIHCNRRERFPLTAIEQIKLSSEAVFNSWNSPRALAWRKEHQISHSLGTAATIQKMVLGNKNHNSFTAVVFSRDCISGNSELMGEYLLKSQGDDLVSGKKTPLNIHLLKEENPVIYNEIKDIAQTLEKKYQAIQDIEITVEDGKIYVLQKRNAVVSPEAKLHLAKELGLNIIDNIQIDSLIGSLKVDTQLKPYASGLSANPGIISGVIIRQASDLGKYKHLNKPFIFFSEQALPEHAPLMIETDAFITKSGGSTSHAAILARSMNKPCIVGLGNIHLKSGDLITLDSGLGYLWKNELPIITQQKNSEKLALEVLKEHNIVLDKTAPPQFYQLTINSWISSLSKNKMLHKKIKYKNFLSIAQKTAAVLLKEQLKKKTNSYLT